MGSPYSDHPTGRQEVEDDHSSAQKGVFTEKGSVGKQIQKTAAKYSCFIAGLLRTLTAPTCNMKSVREGRDMVFPKFNALPSPLFEMCFLAKLF